MPLAFAANFEASLALYTFLLAWLGLKVYRLFYNVFLHPLRDYPGPLAARATSWWKTYVEVVRRESLYHVLVRLHEQYGDTVRVGPNELHFANPTVFHEIYNTSRRWDKDKTLYESFGEDQTSFGYRKYALAKQRKDVLQPLFSRRAILKMQNLVRQKIDHLAERLASNHAAGQPSDLFFAFRCFTMDTITAFCFARSINAIDAPGFDAPIIQAMEASAPAFILFKHLTLFRKLILSLPPWLAVRASPETAGLTHLQVILKKQVNEVSNNPESLKEAPHPIIYHRLLDPGSQKGHAIPSRASLYQEAQALMFGGGDSVGNTLMVGFSYILDQPALYEQLRAEVLTVWPELGALPPPGLEVLETLPLLTATIKEALRIMPGVPSPLLREVPAEGATIANRQIPGGTVVGASSLFVHRSLDIFRDPETFDPSRWLGAGAKELEQWLVAFSKGPRSCLGVNLAWCELYLGFATMLRRFRMSVHTRADLSFRDCFLPHFHSTHLQAWCEPVDE